VEPNVQGLRISVAGDSFSWRLLRAVSIYLNLYWRPYIGVVRAIDVGGVVNVRSTKHLDRGHLLIKPADAMVPTVLVLQHNSVFRLRGWMPETPFHG
jgi:hypothetical protein